MKKRAPDAGDFLESYFLGLSCLVCSEQFYILISQTKASPSFQWYLLLFVAFVTLTLVLILYEESQDELITILHCYYLCFLAFLVGFVWIKITSVLVSTCTTIGIGCLTTFLIIEACVNYSSNAKLLLAFIAGLLSARMLPSFCWILTAKEDFDSQSRSMSLTLSIARFSSCLVSLCIKFMKGELSVSKIKSIKIYSAQSSFVLGTFKKLYKLYFERITTNWGCQKENAESIIFSFIKYFFPIFCFYCSVVFFLPLSPVIDAHLNRKSKFIYSPHVIRSLSILETASHLLGFCIAILFPASVSYNLAFCLINMFNIIIRIFIQRHFPFFLKFFSNIGIYLMVIVYSTLNGYVCSYDLFVIRNAFHNCKNEQYNLFVCCGDKFLTQCYCRYPSIINEKNKCFYLGYYFYTSRPYLALLETSNLCKFILNFPSSTECSKINRFSCSKSFSECNSLDYSPLGPNAILLVQKGENEEICKKLCCNEDCCEKTCNPKCGCLRLCGIYEIDAVTTSTCDDCQLTIRIEGTKCDQCSKCISCGSVGTTCNCVCSGGESGKCCICVKCCDKECCPSDCTKGKCCIKLCCCKKCMKCVCINGTRVFLCYKNNGVCCIREIKPDTKPKFDGCRKTQSNFYISSMFISDCCHSDIQVDLHCRVSEDLFRITPVQYPKKTIPPTDIMLCKNNEQCCVKKQEKCCCVIPLQRVVVNYPIEDKKSKDEKCGCKGSCTNSCCQSGNCCCCQPGKCCPCCKDDKCCCIGAKFTISPENSFDTRMKPVKIKMIAIFWVLFFLVLIFTYLIMSSAKIKELKNYDFKPVTYEMITKKNKMNELNSADDVKRRIDGFLMNSGLESNEYDSELEHMLSLFECTLDPNNFTLLKNHLEEVSLKLLNNPAFILNTKIEMVKWSCCLGLMYTYVIEMFITIQRFFVNWEYVWGKEYKYYRMKMANRINQFTHGSKFGVAALSETAIGLKTYMLIGKSRKDTLERLSEKVETYLDLYEREIEFKERDFPESLDERLNHYIDIWNNRIVHLEEWIQTETIFFYWVTFLEDFPDIRTWVNMFGKYIQGAMEEVVFDEKRFNRGIQVFLIDKIK